MVVIEYDVTFSDQYDTIASSILCQRWARVVHINNMLEGEPPASPYTQSEPSEVRWVSPGLSLRCVILLKYHPQIIGELTFENARLSFQNSMILP